MSVKNSSCKKKFGQDQILEVKIGWDFAFLLKRWYQAGREPCQLIFSRNVSSSWETQRRVSSSLSTDTLSPAWLHVGRYRGGSHPSCPLIYYIPSLLDLSLAQVKVRHLQQGQRSNFHVCWLSCLCHFPLQNLTSPANQLPMRLLQGVLSGQGMRLNRCKAFGIHLQLLSLSHQKPFCLFKFLSKTPRTEFLLSWVSYRNFDTPTLVVMSLLKEKKDRFMTTSDSFHTASELPLINISFMASRILSLPQI